MSLGFQSELISLCKAGFCNSAAKTWYKRSRKQETARDSHSSASRSQSRARGKCFHRRTGFIKDRV